MTPRRRFASAAMAGLCLLATVVALVPLASVLGYVLTNGVAALNLDFFTNLPKPLGEPGGGMANAIVGTLILIGLACLVGLPVGIGAGVYLSEFRATRLAGIVRFTTDVLTGVPSIVIGIFVYTFIVLLMRRFSAIAGGVALGIIMIPTVTRTTEEMLKLVPDSLREASLALGVSQWRTMWHVVLPTALRGIMTGVMLAIARVAGESAPLLFTAFGNRFWHSGLDQPIAALPLQIFAYAISPYKDWHSQAWAGAFVLIVLVLALNAAARWFSRTRYSL